MRASQRQVLLIRLSGEGGWVVERCRALLIAWSSPRPRWKHARLNSVVETAILNLGIFQSSPHIRMSIVFSSKQIVNSIEKTATAGISRALFNRPLPSSPFRRPFLTSSPRPRYHSIMSSKSFKLLCLENPLLDIQGVGYVRQALHPQNLLQSISMSPDFD